MYRGSSLKEVYGRAAWTASHSAPKAAVPAAAFGHVFVAWDRWEIIEGEQVAQRAVQRLGVPGAAVDALLPVRRRAARREHARGRPEQDREARVQRVEIVAQQLIVAIQQLLQLPARAGDISFTASSE